jgi:hypothetical protein
MSDALATNCTIILREQFLEFLRDRTPASGGVTPPQAGSAK